MKSETETNTYRVIRGGFWGDNTRYVRAAFRNGSVPGDRYDVLGFRLVRTVRTDRQVNKWREEVGEGLFDGN